MRIFGYKLSTSQIRLGVLGGFVIEFLAYLSYPFIFDTKEKWAHTYSTGGQFLFIIYYPIAIIILLAAAVVSVVFIYYFFHFANIFFKELPDRIDHEKDIIKRIWDNRGFGKYSLFGGLSFYFHLRARVLAYFFAFICVGIVAWFFVFKQHTYEKTHWKIEFYYNEPLPSFTFKANVPYTIEASEDFYGIMINGRRYITGKNTSYTADAPFMIPLTLPKHWNITFPDTTIVQFMFYEDYISQIFSMTVEVWENARGGSTISPSQFSYVSNKDNNKNKSTNSKKKKRKI